jgi:hypothetical protein
MSLIVLGLISILCVIVYSGLSSIKKEPKPTNTPIYDNGAYNIQ